LHQKVLEVQFLAQSGAISNRRVVTSNNRNAKKARLQAAEANDVKKRQGLSLQMESFARSQGRYEANSEQWNRLQVLWDKALAALEMPFVPDVSSEEEAFEPLPVFTPPPMPARGKSAPAGRGKNVSPAPAARSNDVPPALVPEVNPGNMAPAPAPKVVPSNPPLVSLPVPSSMAPSPQPPKYLVRLIRPRRAPGVGLATAWGESLSLIACPLMFLAFGYRDQTEHLYDYEKYLQIPQFSSLLDKMTAGGKVSCVALVRENAPELVDHVARKALTLDAHIDADKQLKLFTMFAAGLGTGFGDEVALLFHNIKRDWATYQ